MKLSLTSIPGLLPLLLLAELLVHSSPRPTHNLSLNGLYESMNVRVEMLLPLCKKLHNLSGEQLSNLAGLEDRLYSLPHIRHSAVHVTALKVNESLSQLYLLTQGFKIHMDWLKTAKENVSLSSQLAEDASNHLQWMSKLLSESLRQINEEVPQPPSPSLPDVADAFDVLQFSVEIAQRLEMFCRWSKTVLRHLKKYNKPKNLSR